MTKEDYAENGAAICRVTCGWKRSELSLEDVRPFWRDAHSPAIARRKGIYEYRHYPLDPVVPNLFQPIAGISQGNNTEENLMWLSDVRYADKASLEAFNTDPGPDVKKCILGDIDLIVDQSTTYLVLGENGNTLLDRTGDPAPAGPARSPSYQVFLRKRNDLAAFREAVREMSGRWKCANGVTRVRMSLFEIPDMEAERRAGYPIKTHPEPLQYQAWIDLSLESEAAAKSLLISSDNGEIATVHAYPSPDVYTFNYKGRPTLIGLRGYPALKAIRSLGADHQRETDLLNWMYGDVVAGGPFA